MKFHFSHHRISEENVRSALMEEYWEVGVRGEIQQSTGNDPQLGNCKTSKGFREVLLKKGCGTSLKKILKNFPPSHMNKNREDYGQNGKTV